MLTIPRHIRSWMEQAAAPLHDTIPSPITPTETSGHAHGSILGCGGGTADILIGLLWSCSLSPHIWCGVPPGGHWAHSIFMKICIVSNIRPTLTLFYFYAISKRMFECIVVLKINNASLRLLIATARICI